MPLAFASDHAGLPLKRELLDRLKKAGRETIDFGVDSDESVDYPDFAEKACDAVREGKAELAVLVCGSGIGMAMAANRMKGIRAVNASDPLQAKMARRHNDANTITLGSRFIGSDMGWEILETFLAEAFEGGRHQRRVDKIEALG